MELSKKDIQKILIGATFLGTGGGGKIKVAQNLANQIKNSVRLVDLERVKSMDLIITTFGIGNLKKSGNPIQINIKNLKIIKKILKEPVKYFVPVEIGPVSIMNTFFFASYLNIPVVNGDLVGYRASPEIYLESISMNNVNRLPIVCSNSDNDTIVIYSTKNVEQIETILRDFSDLSKSKTYVMGYPMIKKDIQNIFGTKSISYTKEIGSILLSSCTDKQLRRRLSLKGIKFITSGKIIDQKEFKTRGFSAGKLLVRSKNDNFEIIYKNEFIILMKNNNVILTCPDSILILEKQARIGLMNSENNKNKQIMIFVKKATPIWRTKKGLKLFSPKTIGLNYCQKLLSD